MISTSKCDQFQSEKSLSNTLQQMRKNVPLGCHCLPALTYDPKQRNLRYRIFIGLFTFICYTSYHLSRKPLSVVKNVLHANENTSYQNASGHDWAPFEKSDYLILLGSLDYAFLFSYTVGMFISGYVAERTNLRIFLTVGMVLSGVFTCCLGLAYFWNIHDFSYFIVIQIACGLFSSTGWPGILACMANWFGKGRRGLIMGIWNAHTNVGNILGSLIAGIFVTYAWGWSFVVPGIIIITTGIACFLFLPAHPDDVGCLPPTYHSQRSSEQPLVVPDPTNEPRAIGIYEALKIPGVAEFSLSLFFCKLVSYTLLFWLPQYIHLTSDYGPVLAAQLSTLFDVGGIIGGILAGYISDVTEMNAVICAIMLTLGAPMMFLYNSFGSVSYASSVVLLMICGGLINGPYALVTTAVSAELGTHRSLYSTKALSTVSAIVDGTGSFGAAVGPLLAGIIAENGWDQVFYMLIVADVIAVLLLSRLVLSEVKICRQRSPDDN